MNQFKTGLRDILAGIDSGQAFNSLRQQYIGLLHEARQSSEIEGACADSFFSSPAHIHRLPDLRSWVSGLLGELEGTESPPSQNAAHWSHFLGELSPEGADLASQSARRVSDLPGAKKKE